MPRSDSSHRRRKHPIAGTQNQKVQDADDDAARRQLPNHICIRPLMKADAHLLENKEKRAAVARTVRVM